MEQQQIYLQIVMVIILDMVLKQKSLVGIPDPETFCQLPWDKKVARVFVTCFRNREERENPGAHLTSIVEET